MKTYKKKGLITKIKEVEELNGWNPTLEITVQFPRTKKMEVGDSMEIGFIED